MSYVLNCNCWFEKLLLHYRNLNLLFGYDNIVEYIPFITRFLQMF